jgi:tyrosyl-tRNA synthetase
MKLTGPEAWAAYQRLVGGVDTATEQEIAEFEFDDEPVLVHTRVVDWAKVLVHAAMAPSISAASRLIQQGAVSIDEARCTTRRTLEPIDVPMKYVVRCGKVMKRVSITV